LNNLAMLYVTMKQPTRSEPLLWRAFNIYTNLFGLENFNVAVTLTSLAHTRELSGDYQGARQLCQQAHEIFDRVLGPGHSRTGMALKQLARLNINSGDDSGARRLASQARQADEKLLSNILGFASEQQRLKHQR